MSCREIYCIYIGRQLRLFWAFLLFLVGLHIRHTSTLGRASVVSSLGLVGCKLTSDIKFMMSQPVQCPRLAVISFLALFVKPFTLPFTLQLSAYTSLAASAAVLHIPVFQTAISLIILKGGTQELLIWLLRCVLPKVIPITMRDVLHSSLPLHFIPHLVIFTLKPYIREKVEHSRWVAERDN